MSERRQQWLAFACVPLAFARDFIDAVLNGIRYWANKLDEGLRSASTVPRIPGETDEAYEVRRVKYYEAIMPRHGE